VTCAKIRYPTRRWAVQAKRSVDRTLRPYKCSFCGFWHLGHLPDAIRRGERTRGEIYGGDEAA